MSGHSVNLGLQWLGCQANWVTDQFRRSIWDLVDHDVFARLSNPVEEDITSYPKAATEILMVPGFFAWVLHQVPTPVEYFQGLAWKADEAKAIPVPDSRKLPFHKYLQVPVPFSRINEGLPLLFDRNITNTRALLLGGDWNGFYCINARFRSSVCSIDPPMRGIKFQAVRDSRNHEDERMRFRGSGTDIVGNFVLVGYLDPATYFVRMTKRYVASHSWNYVGFITPLGIAGCWGDNEPMGCFWMWKASWVTPMTS